MCLGRMFIAGSPKNDRRTAFGSLKRMITVFWSGVSTNSSAPNRDGYNGLYLGPRTSIVNFTSADEKGRPSCHLTFRARLNRNILPSGENVHEVASRGTGLNFSSYPTKVS